MVPEMTIRMYILMRTDLGMSPGKMVAQAGHGVHKAVTAPRGFKATKNYALWELFYGSGKIALGVNEQQMKECISKAESMDIRCVMVMDLGKTQVPTGSETCIVFHPESEEKMFPIVGHLKLLK